MMRTGNDWRSLQLSTDSEINLSTTTKMLLQNVIQLSLRKIHKKHTHKNQKLVILNYLYYTNLPV